MKRLEGFSHVAQIVIGAAAVAGIWFNYWSLKRTDLNLKLITRQMQLDEDRFHQGRRWAITPKLSFENQTTEVTATQLRPFVLGDESSIGSLINIGQGVATDVRIEWAIEWDVDMPLGPNGEKKYSGYINAFGPSVSPSTIQPSATAKVASPPSTLGKLVSSGITDFFGHVWIHFKDIDGNQFFVSQAFEIHVSKSKQGSDHTFAVSFGKVESLNLRIVSNRSASCNVAASTSSIGAKGSLCGYISAVARSTHPSKSQSASVAARRRTIVVETFLPTPQSLTAITSPPRSAGGPEIFSPA